MFRSVSAGNGKAEAAVQVRNLDDVVPDHKTPKTRRILVAHELNDLSVVVPGSSGGTQAQAAMRVHDRDTRLSFYPSPEYAHICSRSSSSGRTDVSVQSRAGWDACLHRGWEENEADDDD
jgi:hypothetical protein